eukprot:TRINITY_DN1362_c1_g1_i5.p2 TRINITY_DN1362_c1_g1~~TRINITY_DN1362_c1_g1_i5.p2  ORF type:complete len:178 (-),score=14.41 TRINITY_DN1362_c1_g1_i5:64-597(-)
MEDLCIQDMKDKINASGRYDWLGIIGQGEFAFIHKVKKIDTEEILAMKILNVQILQNYSDAEKYVLKEILNHKHSSGYPFIAEFKEAFLLSKYICVVMEYAQEGSLFKYMKTKGGTPLAEDEARTFFQQLIVALKFIQSKDIFVREIKLQNMLLSHDNHQGWWCSSFLVFPVISLYL